MLALISDPLRAMVQRPDDMRGTFYPVQSQPGIVELKQIFQRQRNHPQENHTRTSGNILQQPTLKDASSALLHDRPGERRKADAVPPVQKSSSVKQLRKTNPLLMEILEGNKLTVQYLTDSSSPAGKPQSSVGLKHSDDPTVKMNVSQGEKSVMVSSSCGQIRTPAPSAHSQPHGLRSSPTTVPATCNSSAAGVDRLPRNEQTCCTNAEIVRLIEERIAEMKARRLRAEHNRPNVTSGPCHSTTSSDKKDAPAHRLSGSPTEQRQGQASKVDSLNGAQENAKKGNVSATLKGPNGTTTSPVELCPNVTIDKSFTAGAALPQQMGAGHEIQTSSSGKVSSKHVVTPVNVNSVTHYSLSALKELAHSLDTNENTNAETDDVSKVLLDKYWNGDKANIGVFESTEYPRIMLEVAATCIRHAEDSPVVLTSLSPGSSLCCTLPQEEPTYWINPGEKLPGRDPACEISSIPEHTAANVKENTSFKPAGVECVQSVTDVSVNPQLPRRQSTNANGGGRQSYVDPISKLTSLLQRISSDNVLTGHNRRGQRLSHSGSHSGAETATNNPERSSLHRGTFPETVLKVPEYEDITDTEEPAQRHRKQQPQLATLFEEISDAENQQTVEIAVRSTDGSVAKMKSESHAKLIPEPPQNCGCLYYVETETGFEKARCPKCETLQTGSSQSPSIAVKQTDQSDDEMLDWLVIPIKVSDVTMDGQAEPGDADSEEEQTVTSSPGSVSPPLAAVDTTQSTSTQPGHVSQVSSEESTFETETEIQHPGCESDDSCDTEDSCDYVPAQGRNYLTVSRQAWNNLPAASPSEKGAEAARRCRKHKRRRRKEDRSNLSSGMKDERDNSRTKTSRDGQKPVSSHPEDAGAAPHQLHKTRPSNQDCETVVEKSRQKQLSRSSGELVSKYRSTDKTELFGTETDDSSDDANYKHSSPSSSNSEGERNVRDHKKPKHTIKVHFRPKSQVGQTKEVQAASSEPPQIKETKRDLKQIKAESHVGPAQLKTSRQTVSKANHAAPKAKPKDRTTKKKRALRIYSDSSEAEEPPYASSGVSDSLHVNKRTTRGQVMEAKTEHVPPKTSSPVTPERTKSSDKREKDRAKKKTKSRRLSETEDSEDSFSDSTDSSPQRRDNRSTPPQKRAENPPPSGSSASPSPPSIVNRLYVQESSPSRERLKLSKDLPLKKAKSSRWQPSYGKVAPKPKSSGLSHPAAQSPTCKPAPSGPKQYVPAPRQPLAHSYSHPPTTDKENHSTPTAPAHSSAWEKVKGLWKDQYYPIPVHKKASHGAENDANPLTETEPGPSNSSRIRKRRHSSCKSETPLMKKTKSEAKERTRDINYNPKRRHSAAVADHYKWKNRRDGRETEDSWRQRARRRSSSPELDWD